MSKPFRLLPFLALALFLILPASARAGTAVLLRDIADEPGDSASSSPRYLTPYKDQIAFLAGVPNGLESLWMSDGTGPGTRTIYQTCETCHTVPEIFGTVNGFLLFSVDSGGDGPRRLWRTDGTRAGTIPLTPDGVGPSGFLSEGAPIVFTDKVLYFLSCGETQCGVWRSNGTPAGTTLWKRFDGPGHLSGLKLAGDRLYSAAFDSGSDPRLWTVDTKTGADSFVASWDDSSALGYRSLFTAAGGKLFFVAPVADGSSELWVSDGTAKGTRALTQLEPYYPFQDTEWMKEMGGRLYFVANDVVHGYELWRSDGTPQGTVRVSDFGYFHALRGLTSEGLALAGGKILFNAFDGLNDTRLWISDGRPESTAPFRSLCGAGPCELPKTGLPLVPIGGKVFFPGENGLWSTDGTLAGTHRFSAPPCNWECGSLNVFQAVRGRIAFTAIDATQGIELWTSDGTEAGTRRLTEIPGNISRPAQGPVVAAGPWIYFVGSGSHGVEPWVTNGRETRLLADLGHSAPASGIREQTPVGDRLFFTACDGQESSLWLSGGTPETTGPVPGTAESCSAGGPTRLAGASGRLFFLQRDAASVLQIWSTDGGAPVQVSHLSAGDSIGTSLAVEFQGRLLVPIRTGEQLALWQSNAAGDGLVKLADLPGLSSIEELQVLGGEVYFVGYGQDFELWRTDGTLAGTRKIAAGIYLESSFVRLGSSVLFMAEARDEHGSFVPGLWKTDGTPAGTVLVKAIEEGLYDSPQELTVFQGSLYFMVASGSWELWRSDGTPAGTARVWRSGEAERPSSSTWFGLTAFAGKLFFALDDGVHGRELWTSDGTAGGTRLLIDLNPGWAPGVRDASTLTVAGGRLYFAGNDGVHGIELWESDGTAAGTRLVHDIAPEAASSLPEALTRAGDHLYFVADDILRGRELWALPLAGPSGCQSSSSRLCLNGGRYQVEASWLTREGQSGTGTAVSLSADTGYFWFFDADNVELVAKVLDGQGVNGHVWVFYGALSDVEYTITVTDTQTGFTRRYFNPQGTLASVGDTQGFGPLGAHSVAPEPPVSRAAPSPLPLVAERTNAAAAWPCQASAQRLCLGNGRFALEVSWTAQNRTGKGTAVPLTGDTGTFWFFNAANVELVVKVLDGRPINGRHWVFYGALSNVEYTLTVTDTETGTVRTYKNPGGRFGSVADTGAF
jgi:ELWxxDGT repeat protein